MSNKLCIFHFVKYITNTFTEGTNTLPFYFIFYEDKYVRNLFIMIIGAQTLRFLYYNFLIYSLPFFPSGAEKKYLSSGTVTVSLFRIILT